MSGISGTTRLAGVIGRPLDHSLSPAMHNAVYEAMDLDWVYVPLAVEDEIGLRRVVAAIRSLPSADWVSTPRYVPAPAARASPLPGILVQFDPAQPSTPDGC